ncbi:carbohydrate deacetylase [Ramlibacter sp. AN1133]|uniref:carbohydrate deacetylase n=1 Tax=Ramlibacter sp. AN1133 TaxID=3133429 RepID=UPI0030C13C8C
MPLTVIVNADDFGLTEGVNEAVLACHLAGSVTSTTLMCNTGACEHAGEIARRHPSLGVGLHFNLTTGRPLAPEAQVQSLVDADGNLLTRKVLLQRILLGKVRAEHVEAELHAQLQRMKSLGLHPTHFDSHQHVHAVPQVFRVFARVAEREGLPIRLTWRWPGQAGKQPLRRRVSEFTLARMTRRCQALRPESVASNDGLCSVFDLPVPVSQLTTDSYAQLLDAYSHGTVELMVHPAVVDDELRTQCWITDVCETENRLLRSSFLHDYIVRRSGRMRTYRDLR